MDKIVIALHITICFERDKRLSVGNIATAVKELGLDQKVTEAIIQKVEHSSLGYRSPIDFEKEKITNFK